jgi:LemA protein
MPIFFIFIVIVIIPIIAMIFIYNGLIAKKNQVFNAFGAIEALLKKRYDLIPNLVGAVQNYMQFEKSTLVQITDLRSKAVSGNLSDPEKMAISNQISKALGGIMVAVENYPTLKANENFLQLQAALNETEEQLSAARRAYNAAVTDYNNGVEMFPSFIIANLMGYKVRPFFESPEEEKKNVNVKELFSK